MTLPTAEADIRPRRRYLPALVIALFAGLVLAAVVRHPGSTPRHVVSTGSFMLYTHCGVEGAVIGGTQYVAERPLYREDERGNPPDGWDNPTQRGVMTVYSDGSAVFERPDGQTVTFVNDARRAAAMQPCV